MISQEVISRKYAVAFFNLFQQVLNDEVFWNIEFAINFLNKNPSIIDFFHLPNITSSSLNEMIEILLKKLNLPNQFDHLLRLLVKHKRIILLSDVLRKINDIFLQKKNKMLFEVSSSFVLEDNEKNIINLFLKNLLKKNIFLKFNIDKNLIAGIKIKNNNYLWEHSIQKKLHDLKLLI